ncbi:DUF2231 domain-containing protein [Microbacterium sp. Marseille-Q6965]|uniref:DUF2231 domain-containing protein n=1 Tax=Microbacterium sp. Marseille-Q6965 TaxID=2965072 RepID=UPI0021B6F559|nr:DUF2231 domain-containing protein [Microbacterium sp. Marseille-Q6965]
MNDTSTTRHDSALHRAKHPRTPLAGPYGHPFHAMLITIPIGAWTASIVFDILALVTDDESFAVGATWLIGIGLVGAVLAAVFGLLDLSNLAAGTKARRTGLAHLALNTAAMVLFLVSLLIRLGEPEEPSVWGFVVSVIAFLIVGASGFLGGELAYRFGVRVADEGTQARAYEGAGRRG